MRRQYVCDTKNKEFVMIINSVSNDNKKIRIANADDIYDLDRRIKAKTHIWLKSNRSNIKK